MQQTIWSEIRWLQLLMFSMIVYKLKKHISKIILSIRFEVLKSEIASRNEQHFNQVWSVSISNDMKFEKKLIKSGKVLNR